MNRSQQTKLVEALCGAVRIAGNIEQLLRLVAAGKLSEANESITLAQLADDTERLAAFIEGVRNG